MSLLIKTNPKKDVKRLFELKRGALFERLDVNGYPIPHIWKKVGRVRRNQPLSPFVDCGLVGRYYTDDVYVIRALSAYEFVLQVHKLEER